MSKRYITLREQDGVTVTHAAGGATGNYATLCGCSSDDDMLETIPTPRGKKIDCDACFSLVADARRFRLSDFEGKNYKSWEFKDKT